MIDSQKSRAVTPDHANNPEEMKEPNLAGSLRSGQQTKTMVNQADNATFTDQGSTTMGGATRNNWVHHTPKMAEPPCDEDLETGMSN